MTWVNPHQGADIIPRGLGDQYRTWFVNQWILKVIITAKTRRNLQDELYSHTPASESPWTPRRGLVKFIRETGPCVQLSATSHHKLQTRLMPDLQMHKHTHSHMCSLLRNGGHICNKNWDFGGNLYLPSLLLRYFLEPDEFSRKYHGNILKGHTVFLKSVSSLKMH